MRRIVVGTNIKMYLAYRDTLSWMTRLSTALSNTTDVEICVFVPAICLVDAQRIFGDGPIGYGAQNMHWAESGPYTGELSAGMLNELGCTHVELGHTERRRHFGETDEDVNLKLKRALSSRLRAVVCLGEIERNSSAAARKYLRQQIERLLEGIESNQTTEFILAYEPGWAIGVDVAAPSDYVQEMHNYVRTVVCRLLGKDAADELRIIYGGSIKPRDVPALCRMCDVDGLFVGRSALDTDQFRRIVTDAQSSWAAKHD